MKYVSLLFGLATALVAQVNAAQELQIAGAAGKLHAALEVPEGASATQKCPLVIICHGITGNSEEKLHTELAKQLKGAGIASLRFDFNGHGRSEGRFADMTIPKELADAKAVLAYARKKLPFVKNISLLGHSQGGVVAALLAAEDKDIRSLVLMAPAGVLEEAAQKGDILGAQFDPKNPPLTLPLYGSYVLGRDYLLTAQKLNIYRRAEAYEGPVCVMAAAKDKVVPVTAPNRFHRGYAKSEIHHMEGENHVFGVQLEKSAAVAVDFIKRNTAE